MTTRRAIWLATTDESDGPRLQEIALEHTRLVNASWRKPDWEISRRIVELRRERDEILRRYEGR